MKRYIDRLIDSYRNMNKKINKWNYARNIDKQILILTAYYIIGEL